MSYTPRKGTAAEAILKLLSRGPLYEGALLWLVDASESATLRALDKLRDAGVIERDPASRLTWRLHD